MSDLCSLIDKEYFMWMLMSLMLETEVYLILFQVNDLVLLPDHKCASVYPVLKKYGNDLILVIRRQQLQSQPPKLA